MAIEYKFETENELLKSYASGIANNLEETYDYAKSVIEMAIKSESKKLLCDERQLKHELRVVDTVLLAEKIRESAPRVARVAVVVDKSELDDVGFYETVTNNRGLLMSVSSDYNEAREWLYE
jgi:hypothetical protein